MIEGILTAIFIMDADQYDRFGRQIDNWKSVYTITEEEKYQLGALDYYVLQVTIMDYHYAEKDVIRFLANSVEYYAMRIEGTNTIFARHRGDIIDLKADYYEEDTETFIKDMLSLSERYDCIFNSNSYFLPTDELELLIEPYTAVDLDEATPELFDEDTNFTIINVWTGEAHEVDITLGIDPKKIKLVILDKTV